MSEVGIIESPRDKKIILPKPFWSKDESKKQFVPINTVNETVKIMAFTAMFMGGTHFRRMLQYRKGSARPGTAKYLNMFEISKRQFVSIPLSLGTYSFISSSLYNLNEETLPKNEMLAVSSALLVATVFKKGWGLNKKIGLALGVGVVAGIFGWTDGFVLYDTNIAYLRQTNQLHDQVSNRSLDEEFANNTYKKQGFWETVYRKPLSQTIEELGEGRGIGKQ